MRFETVPQEVIGVRGVGKCYRMHERPIHRLWHALRGGENTAGKEFWALRDADFSIERGQTVGIIGRNGSGKSTLLQMIAGTLAPSEGTIKVQGRVAALLELGSGFNPEFTGRENVYLNATILGLRRDQIEARIESILAFADIGEFIDQPVRSYSSGMSVRLAFAVIAHVDAEILIIDEALAVGDAFFSQKCMRFLRDFQKRGTLLFVSHDAAAVVNLCERAIWLEHGRMRLQGAAAEVLEAYMAEQHVASRRDAEGAQVDISTRKKRRSGEDPADFRRDQRLELGICNRITVFEFDPDNASAEFGAGGAQIRDVVLEDENGAGLSLLEGGERVRLRVRVELLRTLEKLIIGFYVKDRLGQRLFGDNTFLSSLHAPVGAEGGEWVEATFEFRVPIMPSGSYMVDVAVASGEQDDHTQQHWIHDALEFRAMDETMRHGLVGIPMLAIDIAKVQK